MDLESSSVFGIIDHCMFVGMLVVSSAIGLYTAYIGNKSPEEYLMGNRALKPFPVAMSLMTSYLSAVSLLGYSGEVYENGMQISTFMIGAILSMVFSMHFVLPILYPLNLTSINEYIQLRFRSKILSQTISILQMTSQMVQTGIFLYAPTIALTIFTNLNTLQSIILLGIVCTLYSAFGGIRAVVWTDVFQLTVMIVGLSTIFAAGCYQNGGIIKTLHISSEGERLSLFNMSPNPFVRHTFFNTIAMGFFTYLHLYSSYQVVIQRVCAVKSLEGAKSVLKYTIFGFVLTYSLIFSGGLVAYAAFYGCDPMAFGKIKKKEFIIPFFIIDKINFIPGIAGLFSGSIIGASLSSISSFINSSSALMWRDVLLKFSFFQKASKRSATITNIILSLMAGSAGIFMAIIYSKTRRLIEFSFTVTAFTSAPLIGVFLIGFFLPKVNLKGVWIGFVTSIIITVWLTLGGMYYKKPPTNLPFSIEDCHHLNYSSFDQSRVQESLQTINNFTEETNSHSFSFIDLYQLSYTLYIVIGAVSGILLAVIVSFLTGGKSTEDISPKYISPSFRRFYWTEEQLKFIEEREIRLVDCNVNLQENKKEEENNVNNI